MSIKNTSEIGKKKLVSVIMPVYNARQEFLKQAIESILQQSYANLEFIIIDDGSDQTTKNVLAKYEDQDKRVKVFSNDKNSGIVYSLNRALKLCRGEYIFRMDADDVSDRNRILNTITFMDKHGDVDVSAGQYRPMGADGVLGKKTHLPLSDYQIKTWMLWAPPLCHPTVCFRASSVEKLGIEYNSDHKSEDYALWTSLALKKCIFANLNCVLLNYRIHDESVSKTNSLNLKNSNVEVRNLFFDKLGVSISQEQNDVYARFADGIKLSAREYFDIAKIILVIWKQTPSWYASKVVSLGMFTVKYIREILR